MSAEPTLPDPVVLASAVRKAFGSLVAVDGVDLEIRPGEVFGFLGPNGAGKSTLIRMLVGLMRPTSGDIRVLGLDLPAAAETLRSRVGYMTQRFSLYEDLTVEENLDFAAEVFGLRGRQRRERVLEVMEEYGLTERRDQRPATLSGGWKQRLALAAAVVHRPPLLVLDEPTAGVDPSARRVFWAKLFEIASGGTTILVSTHYMDEAVRCHRLCLLMGGRRVALGSPTALTETLAGRVIEVRGDRIPAVIAAVASRDGVASVAQMGDRAHLLLAGDQDPAEAVAPRLSAELRADGFRDVVAVAAEPTLEDVFVAVDRGESVVPAGAEP